MSSKRIPLRISIRFDQKLCGLIWSLNYIHSEKYAIQTMKTNDWRLEGALDAYYNQEHIKAATEKNRWEVLFNKYKGYDSFIYIYMICSVNKQKRIWLNFFFSILQTRTLTWLWLMVLAISAMIFRYESSITISMVRISGGELLGVVYCTQCFVVCLSYLDLTLSIVYNTAVYRIFCCVFFLGSW